jgi:hypothetical protein
MKTLPMGVEDTTFMLRRLSQDCGPLQYLRELTQNAVEAIDRQGEAGQITWTYDEHGGVKKLTIIDTGDGMTADEMQRYLNHLSSSSSRQDFDGNYGLGAKISAVAQNPTGVLYMSWKNGEGHMLRTWCDPDTGAYGLAPFANGEHVVKLRPEARPSEIPQSGTKVVLLGHTDNEDTFSANPDIQAQKAGQWVRKYLNTRYFRLPENIRIDCRTGGGSDDKMRYVCGMGPVLDGIALESGRIELENASAYWWIIPREGTDLSRPFVPPGGTKPVNSMKSFQPSHFYRGHVAAVYRNELHDQFHGRSARTWLQDAGVTFGYDQVVVYVEPNAARTTTDTARSLLKVDGGALPWSDWQDQFRENIPRAIRDLVERSAPRDEANAEIDERILSIAQLFQAPRARQADAGGFDSTAPTGAGAGDDAPPTRTERERDHSRPGEPRKPRPPKTNFAYGDLIDAGSPADETIPHPPTIPRVMWVSTHDEQKSRGSDEFPEYAAWYVAAQNTIKANWDFPVFSQLVDHFLASAGDRTGARGVIERAVKGWYEQTLKETVMGLRALAGCGEWTISTLRDRLSGQRGAELLTAAAMPRYAAQVWIKREVGVRMGRAKD